MGGLQKKQDYSAWQRTFANNHMAIWVNGFVGGQSTGWIEEHRKGVLARKEQSASEVI
jgi:hypothetical protein